MQGQNIVQNQPKGKKKYAMSHYVIRSDPSTTNEQIFTSSKKLQTCVCQHRDNKILKCFKCINQVHSCITKQINNRGNLYQCHQCLNHSLDPLYQVRKVYVSSFFETSNIFLGANIIKFQFTVTPEDKKYGFQIRGLVPQKTNLTWPMQGAFYINDQETPFYDIRPLMANSNRKTRRQQFFSMPSTSIIVGKNCVKFMIYKLDKDRFKAKYQCQETGIYFLSINSIVRVDQDQLIQETFKKRKYTKQQSLAFLDQSFRDIEITSDKLSLVCPYTKNRIKFPVRGKYCKHFNCVCLSTLIVTHVSGRFWNCPMCIQKLNEPYVDTWMLQMLNDGHQGTDVIIKPNGTYQWIKTKQKAINIIEESSDELDERTKSEHTIIKVQNQQELQYQLAKQLLHQIIAEGKISKRNKKTGNNNNIIIKKQKHNSIQPIIIKQQIRQLPISQPIKSEMITQNLIKQTIKPKIPTTIINLQDDDISSQQLIINQLRKQKMPQAEINLILQKKRNIQIPTFIKDYKPIKQQNVAAQKQKYMNQPSDTNKIEKQAKPIMLTDIKLLRCTKMKDEEVKKELRLPKTKLLKQHQDFLNKHHNNVNNLFKELIK